MTQPRADSGLFTLNQIAAMILARRRLVLGTAALIVLLTLVIVLVVPRTWTAYSDLYIDYRENDPIMGRMFSAALDDSYVQTQMDMLRSHVVASAVLDSQGLRREQAYLDTAASEGEARAVSRMIESIIRNTEIERPGGSRVIRVAYSGNSPEQARDIANAIVQSYIRITQDIALKAARSRSEQYNIQLEQLRAELDRIQDEMTRYQRQTGILEIGERDDLGLRQLNELTTQLALLQNRRQEAEANNEITAKLVAQGARIDELPEIAQLPSINDLKSKLSDVNRRLADAQAVYGSNHPAVRGLAQERSGIQARIDSEARAALERNRNEAARYAAQEDALQAAIAKERTALLEEKQHRDRIAAYQRQLASVQQIYNTALQKYDGLLMASNVTTPNLTVLRAAELPTVPARPRKVQSLVASAIVGLVAGLMLALLAELRQRRVRCPDDMDRADGPPLIGRIGHPGGAEPAGARA
ncbi:hypothetical protein V8Z80_01490 [Orrella sp. JC864]|uniref:GumC family protein n=1 Tax=Orrella sp. JC864 TaxID=3120298 RepID=UPI00300845D5